MKIDGNSLLFLAEYWQGQWNFERQIPQRNAVMRGIAQFQNAATRSYVPALDYYEQGNLSLPPDQNFEATRRYSYICRNDSIAISFADGAQAGELFQTLISTPQPTDILTLVGQHQCGADTYDSTYLILDAKQFSVTHRVRGLRNNYVSTTHFHRSTANT